jgi:heme/copper-type cytochrome/quinol oxidase subunit 3
MASDSPLGPIDPPPGPGDEREPSFANPGVVGMWLFLAALTMLFLSGMFGYFIFRTQLARENPNRPFVPFGQIHLPWVLWLSTALVVGVSVFLARAQRQIRDGQQRSYRNSLTAALALACGFLTVQAPALIQLLLAHRDLKERQMPLYGLIFFLVLLHALHVVGGMYSLVKITLLAHRGAYDNAHHDPIRFTALYWHFLDVVWLVMFATFFVLQ